jgi:hypothetical protein
MEKIIESLDIKNKPDQIKREPDTRIVQSPLNVQLPDVTPASIAVFVDPDGKILGEPLLIGGTSYPNQLDSAVIKDAKERSFEATGKHMIYLYQVRIDQSNLPPATETSNNT